MHFTFHPCHNVDPTSVPPPHPHPNSPPQSHVAVAMATAHAARLLAAASLRPLAFRQRGVLWRQRNPATRRGSFAKSGEAIGEEREGRVEGWRGGGGHCGSVSYCPMVLCNFMYTHPRTLLLWGDKHTLTASFFPSISLTHTFGSCA